MRGWDEIYTHCSVTEKTIHHPDIRPPDIRHLDIRLPDIRHPDIRHPDIRHPDIRHPALQVQGGEDAESNKSCQVSVFCWLPRAVV